jgi:hypothetical protein
MMYHVLHEGVPDYAILQKVLNSMELELAKRNSDDFSIPGHMNENMDH